MPLKTKSMSVICGALKIKTDKWIGKERLKLFTDISVFMNRHCLFLTHTGM
jgi:hypothetical protein